jgi:hypothetical protein
LLQVRTWLLAQPLPTPCSHPTGVGGHADLQLASGKVPAQMRPELAQEMVVLTRH